MERNPEQYIPQEKRTVFDASQAKILIGGFLARFETPCTAGELREILTVNENVIGYFTYVEAFEEMSENAMTELDDNGFVKLTETGRQLVEELEKLVPKSLRDRALASGEEYLRDKKNQRDTQVRLTERNGVFGAEFSCSDNGVTLMKVTLWNKDRELADHQRALMNADPVKLYCRVTDHILGARESLPAVVEENAYDQKLAASLREFAESCGDAIIKCSCEALEKGCAVKCECSLEGQPLMELEMNAPDKQQADFICESLEKDGALFKSVTQCVLANRE